LALFAGLLGRSSKFLCGDFLTLFDAQLSAQSTGFLDSASNPIFSSHG
jgi:hypothetical protein